MESRSVCMRAIFSGLSEKNRGDRAADCKEHEDCAGAGAAAREALQKRQKAAAGTFICTLGISLRLIL